MKKHTHKKRYIFLAVTIAVLVFGFIVYAFCFGQSYRYIQVTGYNPVDMSTLEVKSSDESVLAVKSVGQEVRNDDFYYLYLDLEGKSGGNASISLSYVLKEEEPVEKINSESEFYVLPTGMVYNITGKSFAAAKFVIPLFLLIVLLTLGVLTVTFIGKLRHGGFSYSMVFIGGVILFLLVSFIVIMLDYPYWGFENNLISFTDLPLQLINCEKMFLSIARMPMFLLAASLAVSNIWLIKMEGFRIQNALGILMGALYIGGYFAENLTNSFLGADSQTVFYILLTVNLGVTFLLCYFECMLISTMFCAVAATRYKPEPELDYIIILGCAIRRDGTPTPLLKGRIMRAFDFEKAQYEKTGKHAKFVPSGGQGSDEVISEAESMKRCLIELGVPDERIVKEDKSVNTYQNMAFSKQVIERDCGSESCNIGFSTTNYHVFRGYTLAEKLGMTVKGLSAKTKLYFFPNAFIREFIGLLWEKKLLHILYATLITAAMILMFLLLF